MVNKVGWLWGAWVSWGLLETLMVPEILLWPCCSGDAWLPVLVVGPELLLGADSKNNKCLIENYMNLAVWWAGISSWLHGADCLG